MSRPRNRARRDDILAATTRVIAARGSSASTAAIAKEAGVSNGSLFVYFDTKAALFDELYVVLKNEMGESAVAGAPAEADPREQVRHLWSQWLRWATRYPEKRRALAQLEVADEVTDESRRRMSGALRETAELIERSRAGGPMAEVPLSFVLVLVGTMADATMDAIIRDPEQAQPYSETAFEAVWRVLAG